MEGVPAPTRRRNGLVLAIATAAVVLVTLVASGEGVPLATDGSSGVDLTRSPTPAASAEATSQQQRPQFGSEAKTPGAGAFAVAAQAFFILLGLLFFVAGVWEIARMWTRRAEPEDEPVPPAPARDVRPEEIVEVLDEGLAAMAAGPVDDVVIDCWVRLEGAAAAAGVERLASETQAELAARVLGELHAPAPAVERLLVRYRAARFSDHRLDDDDRAVAIRSLEEIRAAIVGASR